MRHYSSVVLTLAVVTTAAGAQRSNTFSVGTARATRGQSAMGLITIAPGVDSGLKIPVAVIHGAKPGPVVAFVAGSHGTEYASIVAMQRLIPRIDARQLSGTVIVAPLLNIP
jgi:predicted deacylase